MNLFTYALLIWAIVTFVLALVELFNHYLTLKGSVYEQSMLDTGVVRRFLHSVIKWSMGAYFVFLFSYVGLALVWLVLRQAAQPGLAPVVPSCVLPVITTICKAA